MRYFEVHKYWLVGEECVARAGSDGEPCGEPENTGDVSERVLGFLVTEKDEAGNILQERWYNCHDGGEDDDIDRVLEEIKADHPAGEWQNNDW